MFQANASLIPDTSNPFLSDLVDFSNSHTNQSTISCGLASRQTILSLFRLNKLQPLHWSDKQFPSHTIPQICCRGCLNLMNRKLKLMYHICKDKYHFTRIFFHLVLHLFCGMATNTLKIKRALWLRHMLPIWQCFLFHATIS